MGRKNKPIKIALIGNTLLTFKGLKAIRKLSSHEISFVFGLSNEKRNNKVNSVDLKEYCISNKILFDDSERWENLYKFCKKEGVDKIITLGDSRIVPQKIISSFYVIGNHGALLPQVKGGASLVWGRMLGSGEWGISIMEIEKEIDGGNILNLKKFQYSDSCTEKVFVEKADDLTVSALIEVLTLSIPKIVNTPWDIKLSKNIDSFKAVEILEYAIKNNLSIYMPTRTPLDSLVKKEWSHNFKEVFKLANNTPYPKWIETEK